jgi:hypothetical protein
MVAGMRTASGSLKGKDGRKRRSVAINLGAEQERSTRGIKSFWRSSALCSAANIYRLFTACGRAKKCVSRQYRRKRLGACGAERQIGPLSYEPVRETRRAKNHNLLSIGVNLQRIWRESLHGIWRIFHLPEEESALSVAHHRATISSFTAQAPSQPLASGAHTEADGSRQIARKKYAR